MKTGKLRITEYKNEIRKTKINIFIIIRNIILVTVQISCHINI